MVVQHVVVLHVAASEKNATVKCPNRKPRA
jgi:hypothetical protein